MSLRVSKVCLWIILMAPNYKCTLPLRSVSRPKDFMEPLQPLQATRGTSRGPAGKEKQLKCIAGLKSSICLQCKFKGATSHVLVLMNWSEGNLSLMAYLSLSLQPCNKRGPSSQRALLHCWSTQEPTGFFSLQRWLQALPSKVLQPQFLPQTHTSLWLMHTYSHKLT